MRYTVFIGFDDVQILDLTGPAEVFAQAFANAGVRDHDVVIASSKGGMIRSSGGLRLDTVALNSISPGAVDTVLVGGGLGSRTAMHDEELLTWLRAAAREARRYGSICSGTFVLAATGLINGRRVASHWNWLARLAELYPAVCVDPAAIYVVDGPVWTSAGVTTGVDMALAMVEADYGREPADAIARELVLYARRPGTEAQISDVLEAQSKGEDRLAEAMRWARTHPGEELTVEKLAEKAGMTARTFHRRCMAVTGLTPAKLVEKLRVEAARPLLADGLPAKTVAAEIGFRDAGRMARAFERVLGVKPHAYRQLIENGTMRAQGLAKAAVTR